MVNGQVKVLDFGLAVARGKPDTMGEMSGTLHYMAPEVLVGGEVTLSADLYAVGVMAFELLAGHYPFNRRLNLENLLTEIIERPADVSALQEYGELAQVIGKLLAKTPAERYASANECIKALCAAGSQPLPAETAAIRDSFVPAGPVHWAGKPSYSN